MSRRRIDRFTFDMALRDLREGTFTRTKEGKPMNDKQIQDIVEGRVRDPRHVTSLVVDARLVGTGKVSRLDRIDWQAELSLQPARKRIPVHVFGRDDTTA